MPRQTFKNPKSLISELFQEGITYEYLMEAKLSIGCQKLAKMFYGKSTRGDSDDSLSAVTIENWICTFLHVQDNPDEEDDDLPMPRNINPKNTWFEYLKVIKTPITQEKVDYWGHLSQKKLGDEAEKIGYLVGIRNSTAIKTLKNRLMETVERRRTNIWSKLDKNNDAIPVVCNFLYNKYSPKDYRLMNVQKLHHLCKERGITSLHMKKDEMIKSLEEFNNSQTGEQGQDTENIYSSLSLIQLKSLAKERFLPDYNIKKSHELVKMLEDYDIAKEKQKKDKEEFEKTKYNMVLDDLVFKARKEDNYIDATSLCKAKNKKFNDWYRLSTTKEFLEELEKTNTEIEFVKTGSFIKTWVHPQVAINISQWISPRFSVQISEWIHTLLRDTTVSIDKPVSGFADSSVYDIIDKDASYLEKNIDLSKFTNCMVLYMSYIGDGLVKIGYSDCGLITRHIRHMSSESRYKQFRLIAVFEISERSMEKLVHTNFVHFKEPFEKQIEVYKIKSIIKFTTDVEQFLFDNDLKMRIKELTSENTKLKLEIANLRLAQASSV